MLGHARDGKIATDFYNVRRVSELTVQERDKIDMSITAQEIRVRWIAVCVPLYEISLAGP